MPSDHMLRLLGDDSLFLFTMHALIVNAEELVMDFLLLLARLVPRLVHKHSHPSRTTWAKSKLHQLSLIIFYRCLTSRNRWTFIIAAICGVTGILVTYFFVPDMTGTKSRPI